MSSLIVQTVLRGYYIYMVFWEPRVGESFIMLHESGNDHDKYAMAVSRDEEPGTIMGHLPLEISKTSHSFTKHEVRIRGEVTADYGTKTLRFPLQK